MTLLEQCKENLQKYEQDIINEQSEITKTIINGLEELLVTASEKGHLYITFRFCYESTELSAIPFKIFDNSYIAKCSVDVVKKSFLFKQINEHFNNLGFTTFEKYSDTYDNLYITIKRTI